MYLLIAVYRLQFSSIFITYQKRKHMGIMAILKAETAVYHAKLESLPYFGELIAHRLPLECYVNQLRALSIIHSVLEDHIATSTNELIVAVWEDGLRKLSLLMEDLHFFEPRVPYDNTLSIEAALSMTEKIRRRSIEHPLSSGIPLCNGGFNAGQSYASAGYYQDLSS